MNTYIFLYDETSFFEVNLVAYFMKTAGNVYIVTEDKVDDVLTNEGIRIKADMTLKQVDINKLDVFVICGGNVENIRKMSNLYDFIQRCEGKIRGGICAGSEIVKNALSIDCNTTTTQVIDESIVLSPGNEYVDFALEIGKAAKIYKDEADYQETVEYFKHFRYSES